MTLDDAGLIGFLFFLGFFAVVVGIGYWLVKRTGKQIERPGQPAADDH